MKKLIQLELNLFESHSVMTCEFTSRVCVRYPMEEILSRGKLVSEGEAIGMIAAQSIGEPGTQLNNENIPCWRNCSNKGRVTS